MVDPAKMCRRHLLGEHVEIHMAVACLNKHKRITGYLTKKLLDPSSMRERHDELVEEMIRRGYNHSSPLPEINNEMKRFRVDIPVYASEAELFERCSVCRSLLS